MPVVAVEPGRELVGTVGGGVEDGGISPFAQRGWDEAFGLAVGARGIGPGEDVLKAELATGQGKNIGPKTGTVIGHDALQSDSEAQIMGGRLAQEGSSGDALLVGQDGGMGQAGMIVDGDKDKVMACGADTIAGVAGDTEAGPMNAGQLLDVDMEQIAGMRPLVTDDGHKAGKDHATGSSDAAARGAKRWRGKDLYAGRCRSQ